MAQADGTILIDTEIDADGMKAGSKEVETAVRRMASSVSDLGTKAKTALNKQVDAFTKLNKEFAAQSQKVDELKKKISEYAREKIPTNKYGRLQKELSEIDKQYEKLSIQRKGWEALGVGYDSIAYRSLEKELDNLYAKSENLRGKLQQLEETGKAFTFGGQTKEAAADMEKLAAAERKLSDLNNRLGTSYSSIKGQVQELGGTVIQANEYVGLLESTLNGLKMAAHAPISVLKLLGNKLSGTRKLSDVLSESLRKLGNVIKKAFLSLLKFTGNAITSGLRKVSNGIFAVHKSANKTSMSLGKMLGMSILFSAVFRAISAVTGGLKEGLDNLALYSDAVNNSLSMLMSSLTQLKNSFATAFAPILTAVAPLLTSFINMISRAITYVGMFIAALTGQDSFVKAVGVQQDYRESLSGTSNSASDAADATNNLAEATDKAAKAAENYLSPLDDVNRYQEEISDNSNSGIGSGGINTAIPGILLPENMFEIVPIKNSIKNIVKKIKDLIKSQDWNGLGEYIASGINKGLQKIYDAINWSNVSPKIVAFTDAFAETFNSLVDNIDWDLLGRTIGAGINTIVNTLNGLADKIDWKNLGKKIAEGINGLFDEVNWYNLGHLIGNNFRIAWDIFGGIVLNLDYQKIGRSVAEALNGVFRTISFSDIAQYLAAALNGAFTALEAFANTFDWNTLVDNIVRGIETFISDFQWKNNGEKLNTFLMNLLNALKELSSQIPWKEFGKGIGKFLGEIDWSGILKNIVEIIKNTLGGLFDGLEASGTAGKIAAFLGKAFIAVKIADITGIGSMVKKLVSVIGKKLITEESITSVAGKIKSLFSSGTSSAGDLLEDIGEAAAKAAGTSSGGGLAGFAKALGPLVGEAGLIVGVGVAATAALSGLRDFIEVMQGGNGIASAFGASMDSYFNVLTEKGWLSSDTAEKINQLKESLESGDMSAEEMKEATNQLMTELSNSGVTADQARYAFDLLRGQYQMSDEMIDALTLAIDGMNTSLSNSTVTVPNTQAAYSALEENVRLLIDQFHLAPGALVTLQTALINTDGSAKTAQDAFDSVIEVLESMGVNTEEAAQYLSEKIPGAMLAVESSVDTHMSNAQGKIESTMKSAKKTTSESSNQMEEDIEKSFGNIDDTTVLKWGNSSREVELNLRAMKLAASKELANMTETVRSYSQSMYNIMTKKFEYMAESIGRIISGIGSDIQNQMNYVISSVNSAISNINNSIRGIERGFTFSYDITNPFNNTRYWGSYSLSLPKVSQIPYLASGAVIPPNKEFMAVLGDQKQGTNIEAPESLIRRIVREEVGNSGGTQRIEVPIYLDKRQIAKAVANGAKEIRQQTGRNPLELA